MKAYPFLRRALFCAAVSVSVTHPAGAQTTAQKPAPAKKSVGPRVSLAPRFVPGQSFRYEMEYETTTETRRTGLTADPQGPTSLVVDWNATVRIDVLPADAAAGAGAAGGIRLRTTYEKSAASVRSDSFDPAADETVEQYRKLEGKAIEFTLDPGGKVRSVTGIEDVVDSEKAAQSARDWVAQLSASAGAPAGGVAVGQTWSSEQPADSLPIAGLVWHTDSEYLGNESCHPANPDVPTERSSANEAPQAYCAVVLAKVSLAHSKSAHDLTPPELKKNGVESSGKWTGTGQSLLYVSLASGFVVSATQTGSEEMDVTLTSNHNTAMHYFGTISSRSQVELVGEGLASDRAPGKP